MQRSNTINNRKKGGRIAYNLDSAGEKLKTYDAKTVANPQSKCHAYNWGRVASGLFF